MASSPMAIGSETVSTLMRSRDVFRVGDQPTEEQAGGHGEADPHRQETVERRELGGYRPGLGGGHQPAPASAGVTSTSVESTASASLLHPDGNVALAPRSEGPHVAVPLSRFHGGATSHGSAAASLGRSVGPADSDGFGRRRGATRSGLALADDLVGELIGVAGLDVPLPPGSIGVGHPRLDLGGVAADRVVDARRLEARACQASLGGFDLGGVLGLDAEMVQGRTLRGLRTGPASGADRRWRSWRSRACAWRARWRTASSRRRRPCRCR